MEESELREIRAARRKFAAMAATYFLGVFNDNFFKQAILLAAVGVYSAYQGYLTVVFAAPFILFAAPAGWAADRFPKRSVVIGAKVLELAAMCIGAVGIVTGNWPLLFTMLALMALQSTIFGPALNGSIPELYPESYVLKANAVIKVVTTCAILIGVALAGLPGEGGQATVAVVVIAVAVVGVLVSLGVPRRKAASPDAPFPRLGIVDTFKTLKAAARDRLLFIAIMASGVFWFVGSLQILLINELGKNQFALGDKLTSALVAAELLGVAAGGMLAGRFAYGRRWYKVLAPSSCALGLFMAAVSLVPSIPQDSPLRFASLITLLVMMGMAGGIFLVPVASFIQVRPSADRKGRVIAAGSFISWTGILLSGPASNFIIAAMRPSDGFAAGGVLMLAVSAWLALIWHSSQSRRSPFVDALARRSSRSVDRVLIVIVKFLLSLRYRVRVQGLEEVRARGTGSILFLPNHPAFIDPFIVLSVLNRDFAPHSLADRDQIDRPVVGWLSARFGARAIPDASKYHGARKEIEAVLARSVEGLRQGENLLFYPAGRINRSYLEDLGANSAVEAILKDYPDVRIVLLRTRGLWGSLFSRAWGHHPEVSTVLLKAIGSLLLSGLFFAPRREVSLEFHEPDDFPRDADRFTMNRYMEAFYNEGALHNTYVPYTPFERGGTRIIDEVEPVRITGRIDEVSDEVRRQVRAKLQEMTGVADPGDDDLLGRSLGLDSLSRVDLGLWLEEEYALTGVPVESLQTVSDVMLAASGQTSALDAAPLKDVDPAWYEAGRLAPVAGETLTEAFLAQARHAPDRVIIADQTAGALSYRKVVTAVMFLRNRIEKLPGDTVGIMLPASVAADLVYLAALFSGKTPVMVNWTVGVRNMTHSLELLNVRHVITAKALVSKIAFQLGDLGPLEGTFSYLEDMGRARLAKLFALAKSRLSWRSLAKATPSETAVVLFTSGSESLPKAVPLTHRNILANIRDVVRMVEFRSDDRMVGIFPPFHSFGVTCTMLYPLTTGVRVVHYPNPTEGAEIARTVEHYKATLLLGTPTFLRSIVRAASPGQLDSLRMTVSGAEKCPESVYASLAECCPSMTVLEGYGTSECSPVISVNEEETARKFTIGKVLPAYEYAIVSTETGQRVPPGQAGELLVRGESVFGGYLHYEGKPPFVEFEGKEWYRTGDLVVADEDGILSFAGRLKRFVKLGGEMISLPAIEAVLEEICPASDEGEPAVAVVATPDEENPELVLFATADLDRAEVNRAVREAGLSALHSIRRIVKVDEIPLLGTGKTDYRSLSSRLRGDS